MDCDTNFEQVKDTNEDIDEYLRDPTSRESKHSECDEDESWFEADYEPEDTTDTEDIRKESEEAKEDIVTRAERSKRRVISPSPHRYLLSEPEDDDIEVINVINHEKQTCETPVKEGREESQGYGYTDRLQSSSKEKRSLQSQQRSKSGTEATIDKHESNSFNIARHSLREKDENPRVLKEQKYSRADLEKVKAFFSANRNKRKESDHAKPPTKKMKGNNGIEIRNCRDNSSEEKIEREGKNSIPNYIPYPSVKNISFQDDIKVAFKGELTKDVLESLTPKFCGLCFKDLEDDDAAWRHYTGTGHKGTIKRFNKGTYKGHPPYWRMIHERLCRTALAEKDILEEVCVNYNVGENKRNVEHLVRKSLNFLVQYKQIGKEQGDGPYFIINRNSKEVGKIFENYNREKRSEDEAVLKSYQFREEPRTSRGNMDGEYERRLFTAGMSSRDERLNYSFSGHSSSSRTPRFPSGPMSNPEAEMLVVDPSKLRMLPNGQIMIKSDDITSMRKGQI